MKIYIIIALLLTMLIGTGLAQNVNIQFGIVTLRICKQSHYPIPGIFCAASTWS
jgi:hypothetical protein